VEEHVACMGKYQNVCSVVVGNDELKRICRKHRHIWEDNIKNDI
jgi:hypothetical protein